MKFGLQRHESWVGFVTNQVAGIVVFTFIGCCSQFTSTDR